MGIIDDPPLAPTEKLLLYERFVGMNLPQPVLETMVFVLEINDEQLELSRNEVEPEHLALYARLYPMLPTWDHCCALAYVLQDQKSDSLIQLRRDVLRAPVHAPLSIRHIAKATALAWLQGDIEQSERYLDDLDSLEQDAASWRIVAGG